MNFLSGKRQILIGTLCFLIGAGMLIGGFFYNKSRTDKLNSWTQTTGVVVDYKISYDTDDDGFREEMYSEIVEFEVNGTKYTATDNSRSNVRPKMGKERVIAYNPDNPNQNMFVASGKTMLILLFALGGLFALLGAGSLVTVIVSKKKSNENV